LQTPARFWEKKTGGVKRIKIAKRMEIPRQAFKKAMAFMRIKSILFL